MWWEPPGNHTLDDLGDVRQIWDGSIRIGNRLFFFSIRRTRACFSGTGVGKHNCVVRDCTPCRWQVLCAESDVSTATWEYRVQWTGLGGHRVDETGDLFNNRRLKLTERWRLPWVNDRWFRRCCGSPYIGHIASEKNWQNQLQTVCMCRAARRMKHGVDGSSEGARVLLTAAISLC